MNSLFLKHFSLTAVLVIISFTFLGALFVFLGRNFTIDEKKDSIYVNAEALTDTAAAYSNENMLDSWNFRIIVSTVAESTGNQILVSDSEGFVLVNTKPNASASGINKRISQDILAQAALNASQGKATILDGYNNSESFYMVIMPVYSDSGKTTAYVFVGSDMSPYVQAWTAPSRLFIFLSMGIMLLSLMMSYVASRLQSRPINEMAAAAKRFARGDFSVRVTNYGSFDEIGALTESFNSMADSLERSEQLRSDFIANVSHELKTPMTTISGFADGLLDGTIPQSEQGQYLEIISSETKRLSRMVRQMLQMSRIQNADTSALLSQTFDLSEMVMRTLLAFENKITAQQLDVDAQIPEENIIVRGDPDSITQVFYNLLDNAVKFAEKGSSIGVSIWKQDGRAHVSVKNSGECISPEDMPHIFDRFHKTDRSRSRDRDGVGLGLSIVKTILNNHKENIYVTSRNGETEFIFTVRLKNS